MLGKTHLLAGITSGAAIGLLTGDQITGMTITGVAALLPDIDEPNSMIGRRLPVLAWPIRLIFGHRTITHTVEFAVALAVIIMCITTAWVTYPQNTYLGIYVLAGILSHILLDSLTRSGVALFASKPNIHPKGPFKTGNVLEYLWISGFGFSLICLLR